MRIPKRRVLAAASLSAAIALVTAACGSGTESAGESLPPLTVALSALDASQAEGAVAEAKGYFKEVGLSVKFVNSGSNVVAAVVSGQADIGAIGLPGPMLPAAQGKSTTILAEKSNGAALAQVAGRPGVTDVQQCKTVSTTGVGTGSYGLTKYFEKSFNTTWTIKTLSSGTDAVNLMATGQADCTVLPSSILAPALSSGKGTLLVDGATRKGLPAGFPTNLPSSVVFGLTDNLGQKKAAVTAFLTAYVRAVETMNSSPDDAAKAIITVPGWNTQSVGDVVTSLKAQQPARWPNRGVISEGDWQPLLSFIEASGVALDGGATAPTWSFGKRVDMSYLDAALGKAASHT
ncbi:ABC transporter substrate-binding protein [Pseudonocardia ailaonensis]